MLILILGVSIGAAYGCNDGSNKYVMTEPLALWKHFPILYYFDNSTDKTMSYGITVAFNHFNHVAGYEFYKQTFDPTVSRINISFGNIDGRSNTLAWTHYNTTANIHEITNATIKFDSSENWDILDHGRCNTTIGDTQDIISVAVHEIGHLSGLGHSDGKKQTMYYQNLPGQTLRRTLGLGDIEGFKTAYNLQKHQHQR